MTKTLATGSAESLAPLPDNAVTLQGLGKTYKASGKTGAKVALKNVDLEIPRGHLFGLLGPNGAGKSTLINILAGLVNKTEGRAEIWGYDIDRDARQSRAAIGVVPQELNIDPFFTPYELLELQAGLYGVPPKERKTDEILSILGLSDKAKAYTRTLSGGMRRRLMVAKAMVHSPPILVLDEPTAGVDIELRQQLWERVRQLNRAGTTVLLTTHYLEEAEELCDEIAIINHGSVIACVLTDEDGNRRIHAIEYITFDPKRLDEADELTQQCEKAIAFADRNVLPRITVETNGLGRMVPGTLRRLARERGLAISVREQSNRTPKALRILDAFDAALAANRLYAHADVLASPLISEMRDWRPDTDGPDDGLDAVAGCLLEEPYPLPAVPAAGRPKPRRDWRRGIKPATARTDFAI